MHELLTSMVHKRYVPCGAGARPWASAVVSGCLTAVTCLRLQVYPLHSSVTLEEQNNVFLSPVPGYRKVGQWGCS